VSHLLWSRVAGNASETQEVAKAAEQMYTQLRLGLGRWIGVMGYRALLDRALGLARAEYPALAGLSCHGGEEEPEVAAAVRAHGAAEVAAGMVAVVAVLIDLLGRIIGEEMALRLVEQTGMERGSERQEPAVALSTQSAGGSDARAG
jgi:hypothetical protein